MDRPVVKDILRTQRIFYSSQSMRRSLPAGFCAAPFTQMFIYPTGDVFVCCEGAGHLGNLKDRTLMELWNGPAAKKLRQEFLSGKPMQCQKRIDSKACNKCYDDQLAGAELSETQASPPVALDLIIDGTCNLDCIMCEVKDQRTSLLDLPEFQKEIEQKVFPTVKKISLKSGEPFVQKATFEVISKVAAVNPDCLWQFTTNGQYKFGPAIQNALDRIKVERVTFSVDAVDPELFAEIRKNGTLERCERTIGDFAKWADRNGQNIKTEFAVNVTLQRKNWRNVPEVLRDFTRRKIPVSILYVEKPMDCSLSGLELEQVLEILECYLALPSEYDPFIQPLYRALTPLVARFPVPAVKKLGIMLQHRIADYRKWKKSLCPFPFTQMALYPDGSLKPCCWLSDYDLREKEGESFGAAWNGKPLQALREEHLSGEIKVCKDSMKRTQCHKAHSSLSSLISLEAGPPAQIMRFDWFFSGKCNLECRSCNNWKFSEEFPGSEAAWESLKKDVLPYICEIDLKGGEPFYQKRTFTLMETLREINPLCVWDITTNGQIRLTDKITGLLDGLLLGNFTVSIDSLDPARFSTIRVNGELQKTLEFLDDLIAYNEARPMGRKFHIVTNFVFQKENWAETEAFLAFAREKKITPSLISMFSPFELSVYSLPEERFREVRSHIDELASKYKIDTLTELQRSLRDHRPALAPAT